MTIEQIRVAVRIIMIGQSVREKHSIRKCLQRIWGIAREEYILVMKS